MYASLFSAIYSLCKEKYTHIKNSKINPSPHKTVLIQGVIKELTKTQQCKETDLSGYTDNQFGFT